LLNIKLEAVFHESSFKIYGYWGTISTTGQKAFLVEKTKEVWVVQSASVNPDGSGISGISGVGELASPDAEFVDNTTN